MSYITIEEAKHHLNIEPDFNDDDIYIKSLIDASEDAVIKQCNEDINVLTASGSTSLPSSLKHAVLLMIGHLYQNREIVGIKNITLPKSYDYLIQLYQNYNR